LGDKRSGSYTDMRSLKIQIGLMNQTTDEIGEINIEKLNMFLESNGSNYRFRTNSKYDDALRIEWYYVN
jgi:hypothetical protein